jgi:hypothetical protein
MSCGNSANIRIEPVDATWEIEEKWCIDTVADVSQSLENKYFKIHTALDAIHYYIWYEVGGSGGIDPAIAGYTGVKVSISTNATATAVATATAAAIDALAGFVSTSSSNTVTITCVDVGDTTNFTDGAAATGFTFTQQQDGGTINLGLLDGDVEVSFEETLLEVTAHQSGVTPLADLRQGVVTSLKLTLKESHLSLQKEILAKAAGGTYTPSGGSEVFGWGVSRQGLNTVVQARRLILHPVALSSSDYSRDMCFWKAYPIPESIVFSGENPETMSVTFKIYLDDGKPDAIQQFIRGNWNQTEFIP